MAWTFRGKKKSNGRKNESIGGLMGNLHCPERKTDVFQKTRDNSLKLTSKSAAVESERGPRRLPWLMKNRGHGGAIQTHTHQNKQTAKT